MLGSEGLQGKGKKGQSSYVRGLSKIRRTPLKLKKPLKTEGIARIISKLDFRAFLLASYKIKEVLSQNLNPDFFAIKIQAAFMKLQISAVKR